MNAHKLQHLPLSKSFETQEPAKRRSPRPQDFVSRSALADLLTAIGAFILLMILFGVIGCAHRPSGPEPVWAPSMFAYSPMSRGCAFVSDEDESIDCEEPKMHDLICVRATSFEELSRKFARCEVWR